MIKKQPCTSKGTVSESDFTTHEQNTNRNQDTEQMQYILTSKQDRHKKKKHM